MAKTPPPESCQQCWKPQTLCGCASLQPQETTRHILILQHPQEPDEHLGSARLAHLQLPQSVLKVGLSWPNLAKALGREAQATRWAVLYLGSGIQGPAPSAEGPALVLVDKKGAPLPGSAALLPELEGIVVLDGTWSQAKALWWRNPWLLKLRRAVLIPGTPSLYGNLRKEPRRECLSTIESVAQSLQALGEAEGVSTNLTTSFSALLERYRANQPARPKRDWRKRRRHSTGGTAGAGRKPATS